MKSSLKNLRELILESIKVAGFESGLNEIQLAQTKTLEHGHFSTNIAMLLANKYGKRPQEVAESIKAELEKESVFTKVEIAGPGFINVLVEQNFYTTVCQAIVNSLDDYLEEELDLESNKKTVVIEYSSPNIAKPLGAHHLLSTIIGDSLAQLFRRYSYKVIAENYPGDMGTQFGKLIYAIRTWGDESTIEKEPIDELLKLYVRFHNEAEKDPSLEDFGRTEYKKFEEGDAENRKMWEKIVDWTFADIQPLYDRLGIRFDAVHGESFFEDKMEAVLKEGRSKGVFVDGEKGSWIVMPDDPKDPPALVKKSDGTTLYLTRDLAQVEFFEKEYHPDLMVWAVDVAQSFHFNQRFQVARKLKLTGAELKHVEFGRMQFKDGAMSTRKGNIIKLKEVLDEAVERSVALIEQKGAGLSDAEKQELARIMGIGAVKYNILHQNRVSNITFDWDQMLSMEGNSAPYLMYTVARAKSILRKAEIKVDDTEKYELSLNSSHETQVALGVIGFAEALKRAVEEFKPNHIANYLYHLAQSFNAFYNALPVLKAESKEKETRLLLIASVIQVMETAFGLLGLEVPEKM